MNSPKAPQKTNNRITALERSLIIKSSQIEGNIYRLIFFYFSPFVFCISKEAPHPSPRTPTHPAPLHPLFVIISFFWIYYRNNEQYVKGKSYHDKHLHKTNFQNKSINIFCHLIFLHLLVCLKTLSFLIFSLFFTKLVQVKRFNQLCPFVEKAEFWSKTGKWD